jgi:DNA-binding beta-propeller fold protein YncE
MLWPLPPDRPRLEFIDSYKTAGDLPHNRLSRLMESFAGKPEEDPLLIQPRGVFADSERIYVADEGRHNIIIFDLVARSTKLMFNEGVLVTPLDLTADQQGNFYIADAGVRKVLVFSATGAMIRSIGSSESLQQPAHLAINPNINRLYVSDSALHCIIVYDLSGNLLFSFGGEGSEHGEFRDPRGLIFDRKGRLFVADSGNARIQIFDQDGLYLGEFGKRGTRVDNFIEPTDLALDSAGNLHIIDQGLIALLSYSTEGKVLLATGSGTKSFAPMGLAKPTSLYIDGDDRIFIADLINRRVATWQYLSSNYLAKAPINHVHLNNLERYLNKTAPEHAKFSEEDIQSAISSLSETSDKKIALSNR